jgi:hypothetical protein
MTPRISWSGFALSLATACAAGTVLGGLGHTAGLPAEPDRGATGAVRVNRLRRDSGEAAPNQRGAAGDWKPAWREPLAPSLTPASVQLGVSGEPRLRSG